MTLKPIEKAIALSEIKRFRKMFEEHDEARIEYAKQGYRNHYCVHGTNLWTDYDNICGPCEDGYGYWDYQNFAELAIQNARSAVRHAEKMFQDARKWQEFFKEFPPQTEEAKGYAESMVQDLMEQGMSYLSDKIKK